jgi:hypothetical protein
VWPGCPTGIFRNSCGRHQTSEMRLPQRSIGCVSNRVILSLLLLAVASMLPSSSHAATERLSCSPPLIRFGQVTVGESVTQPVVLTNSGATSATISGMSIDDSEFRVSGVQLPVVLPPGESVTVQITFAPTVEGYTGAKVAFTSDVLNSALVLPVNGVGANRQAASASPAILAFGNVPVEKAVSLPVVLTCKSCAEVITGLLVEGNGFSAIGPKLPVKITPKNGITLQVTFKPGVAGATSGSVLVVGLGLNIPVTGSGTTSKTVQLSVAPSQLNFGDVNVGSSSAQTATLAATGGTVTVSSASSSNSQFTISGTSFPLTIASGQSAEVKIVFSPTKTGADSGSVTVTSNASNSGVSESVNGTGVSPQYSVALSWNPSTSSVAGYNVYRGTASGVYSKINNSLDGTTTYTDSTVASGMTYYYAATAVSPGGQESGYSSPLKVTIP